MYKVFRRKEHKHYIFVARCLLTEHRIRKVIIELRRPFLLALFILSVCELFLCIYLCDSLASASGT